MKKTLALILALAMVFGTMSGIAFAADAADVWDGTADTSWYNETYAEFTITTAEQLAGLAALVNAGKTFAGKKIALDADIDLAGKTWTPIGTSIYDKNPATSDVKMFSGSFDGNNHTIKGLATGEYVPAASETASTEYSFGLFGYIYGANISNVKLANVNINGTTRKNSDGNNVAGSGVAALIGYAYVDAGKSFTVSNCHVLGGQVSASNNMGGLIGFVDSQKTTPQNVDIKITDCSNNAKVTSEAREAGGILGLLNASRDDYSPTMAGSITFKNCVNSGNVTTYDGGGVACAGGILGKDQNEYSNQQLKIIFDSCVNSGTITVYAKGETHVAGLGTSFYSHGVWLVAKNSSNTGDIVVKNPENADDLLAGGLFAYAGVMDVISSTSTGSVKIGDASGNKYVGKANHILFVDGIKDFEDEVGGYTYYLNGGNSPEFSALVDDVANWGGNFNVLVKTAVLEGSKFEGWYDNAELQGEACTTLKSGVNTYYAKWTPYEAKIGDVAYTSFEDAIAAANSGDVIKVFPGEYNAFTIPKGKDNITITGNLNYGTATAARAAVNKPVIKISEVTDGGVEYHAANVTFDNLVFEVTEGATGGGWNCSALGYYYEIVADRNGLAITNCDFINNSDLSIGAIAANIAKYTVANNTFKNFATGVWSYVDHGAADEIVVSDNTFENVPNLVNVYHGVAADGTANVTITNNKATDGSTTQIAVTDFGQIKATPATAYDNVVITGNAADVVIGNYAEASFDTTIENNESVVYSYASEDILKALEAAGIPEGDVYVAYGAENETVYKVVDGKVYDAADEIEVVFALDSETEGEKLYNINLKANAEGIINRLNSVDLTFLFTQISGNNDFEIIASNPEVAINPVDNSTTRYEFHYNGKDNTTTDTDTEITIGQVKFTGYGSFNFAVDTSAEANATNVAHATKFEDNIVDTFIPNGDVTAGEGNLDLTGSTTGNVTIAVPTRELTINVAFPNAVEDKEIAYQDMKVVISGGDLAKAIEIDLGSDAVATDLEIFGKEDAKYVATFANDAYKVIVTDVLTVNNAYTVTVSGAGYRTARYTVTMTDSKELNFWNNVMDEKKAVEPGKASSEVTKNFLAGDIVKDNQINIYDLSAVVSYFASTSDVANGYAKYDLNRDGTIDSKDVAYVLVSWGE